MVGEVWWLWVVLYIAVHGVQYYCALTMNTITVQYLAHYCSTLLRSDIAIVRSIEGQYCRVVQ